MKPMQGPTPNTVTNAWIVLREGSENYHVPSFLKPMILKHFRSFV
jgi:hypothetical protein